MKTKLIILLLLLAVGIPAATNRQNSTRQLSWSADNGNGTYTNPLFYDVARITLCSKSI